MGKRRSGNDDDLDMAKALKFWVATVFAACVGLVVPGAYADDLGAGIDHRQKLIVVPPLAGALSAEAGMMGRFGLSGIERLPSLGLGATLGWRSFLDDRGASSIRTYALVDRAGIESRGAGGLWRVGGGVQWLSRGVNDDFFTAGWGLGLEGSYLRWTQADTVETGWQVFSGVELNVGGLFATRPFLFAESVTSIGLSYSELVSESGLSLELRWVVRFDWAFRRER